MSNEVQPTVSGSGSGGAVSTGRRALLANSVYAVTGNGFYYACQLGVASLLAKFASPTIQGEYFLGLAIATPIVLFFGLELRGALVADSGNQFTFGTYRTLRTLMMVPAALILAGVLLWKLLTEALPVFVLILAGVFAARIIWSVAEVGWGTFQRRERLDLLAVAVTLRGLALIVPFALILPLYHYMCITHLIADHRLPEGTALAIILSAVGFAAVLWLYDRPRTCDPQRGDMSWDRRSLWGLARQTFPLGVVALVISLCDSYPRYLIGHLPDGEAQLGYFGALASITLAGNLFILQVATAASNRLSVYYQRDRQAFLRLGGALTGLALLVGGGVLLVAWFFGQWILRVLYTSEYAQFENEFRIIVGAHCLALLTNIFGTATTQMRLFWVQVPVQVVTLIATIAAANLLIPASPVRGAAYTALVRAVVQFVLYAACVTLGLVRRRTGQAAH